MSRFAEWWRYRRQRRADQRAYRKDRRTSASEKQQRLKEHRPDAWGSGQGLRPGHRFGRRVWWGRRLKHSARLGCGCSRGVSDGGQGREGQGHS